jgi:hypothetical protein
MSLKRKGGHRMAEKKEIHLFTYRHEKSEWVRFAAAATLNDTTPTEIFKETVQNYLAVTKDEAVKRLEGNV